MRVSCDLITTPLLQLFFLSGWEIDVQRTNIWTHTTYQGILALHVDNCDRSCMAVSWQMIDFTVCHTESGGSRMLRITIFHPECSLPEDAREFTNHRVFPTNRDPGTLVSLLFPPTQESCMALMGDLGFTRRAHSNCNTHSFLLDVQTIGN